LTPAPAAGRLRLGTRGSALARTQAGLVARALERLHPGLRVEEQVLSTRGDREADRPLAPLGGKGLFVREIEQALLAGEIDLAVHSLKDLPAELPPGLALAAVPERADPADALVSPRGDALHELPPAARVATGSPRRAQQLRLLRADLDFVPLRGNVDTRLRRLEAGDFEALVLAVAGLTRLGRLDSRAWRLDPASCIPAPGQGALGIEVRSGSKAEEMLRGLHHEASGLEVRAERALVQRLGGGCQVPLGALARVHGDHLRLTAFLADDAAERWVREAAEGEAARPEEVGRRLADRILGAGGEDIVRALSQRRPADGDTEPE
jgi:hydroxymethylbilane synthase